MSETSAQEDGTMPIEKLTPNADIMANARQHLNGKWGFGVLVSLLYFLISAVPSGISGIGGLVGLIVNGPITLGLAILFLSFVRSGEASLSQIFEGFNRFKVALITYLLMVLYIILWSLLLIIPGVIAAFSYSMTFFILADNPDITASGALSKSKQIMNGYKLKLFYMACRFIPWALLSILTLGIGFLWLFPYLYTSITLFYEDIKGQGTESQF